MRADHLMHFFEFKTTQSVGNETMSKFEDKDTGKNPNGFAQFCDGKDAPEIIQVRTASPTQRYAKAEKIVLASTVDSEARNSWTQQDWENNQRQTTDIFNLIAHEMNSKNRPESPAVQTLIAQHYHLAKQFYNMSPQVYVAMAQLFQEHPGFRTQLDLVDSLLADFMAEAMSYYARHLS